MNVLNDAGKWTAGYTTGLQLLAGAPGAINAAKGFIEGEFLNCALLQKACFRAGTPILTPEAFTFIEMLREGDQILSRDEDDPNAPIRIEMVHKVFKLQAQIWELHVAGRQIDTSAEHPFYVVGFGWTPLCRIKPGDVLKGRDEQLVVVDRVVQTDRTETVYTVSVEPGRTFFVGCDEWGFSLWVHNSPCSQVVTENGVTTILIRNKFPSGSYESGQLQRFVNAWNQEIAKAGGSMVRRGLNKIEEAAAKQWRESMRSSFPVRFANKIVGHVPDAAAGGVAKGGRAMALSEAVNSYLAGVLSGIKKGQVYQAVELTRFLSE